MRSCDFATDSAMAARSLVQQYVPNEAVLRVVYTGSNQPLAVPSTHRCVTAARFLLQGGPAHCTKEYVDHPPARQRAPLLELLLMVMGAAMAAFPTFNCPGLLTETAPPFLGLFRSTHSPTGPGRYWACLNDSATVSAGRRKWTSGLSRIQVTSSWDHRAAKGTARKKLPAISPDSAPPSSCTPT